MRRVDDLVGQPVRGDVADVIVALGLYPGPAVVFVVEAQHFAAQKLGVERGIRARITLEVEDRGRHLTAPALDVALGFDGPAQVRRGEVAASRRQPRIVDRHGRSRAFGIVASVPARSLSC